MPTFYEGEPIAEIEQSISEAEWGDAYYTAQSTAYPIRRKEVKAGICLTAAALMGSVIPLYRARFSTVLGPVCGILFALALAAAFYFIQPREIRRWGRTLFRFNALLAQPEKITVYRDSVVIENAYEKLLEYWTDFAKCTETATAFVVTGGLERNLLVLRKEGLEKEQIIALSKHFSNTFAARYEKTGR